MAFDDEGIGKAERDGAIGRPGGCCRLPEGCPRILGIKEIAFEIKDPRGGDRLGIDVMRGQAHRRAEKGAHGALSIRRDVDEAPAGGRAAVQGRRIETRADGPDVMGEDFAQRVPGHLADKKRSAAEAGDPGDGIGRRAAGSLDPRGHAPIELMRARLVDEAHRALVQTLRVEEGVVGPGQDIDDGVADRGDVVSGGHDLSWRGRGEVHQDAGAGESRGSAPTRRGQTPRKSSREGQRSLTRHSPHLGRLARQT